MTAGLLAAGYVFIYLLLKRRISRTMDPARVLESIRQEVDQIIVELNQTTNRNITLVEDRLASLRDLLAHADRKLGLLRREQEKQERGAQVYTDLAKPRPQPPQREQEKEREESDPQLEVLRLHASGFSPALIARRTGKTVAEVELIISLAEARRQG